MENTSFKIILAAIRRYIIYVGLEDMNLNTFPYNKAPPHILQLAVA